MMQLDPSSLVPLYQQIADNLRAGILDGLYPETQQIPSTTQIARDEQMNPATVLKGMNQLVADGLVEKRRGLGMFVRPGAVAKLREAEKHEFMTVKLTQLIRDAQRLGINRAELLSGIEEAYQHDRD